MAETLNEISEFLSRVLRHEPDSINLEVDAAGWVVVSELIQCANAHGHELTPELIREVAVAHPELFLITPNGRRIRAEHGHSIDVDLHLHARTPPKLLFHGTAAEALDTIFEEGLTRGYRDFVHLTHAPQQAMEFAERRGEPALLVVDARQMSDLGFSFYLLPDGTWATRRVLPKFLREAE